jgi:hypothetical protein
MEKSYLANLKKVKPFIEQGKITPAINQLRAFVRKVEHDIAHGNIDSEDGAMLIDMANELIDLLKGEYGLGPPHKRYNRLLWLWRLWRKWHKKHGGKGDFWAWPKKNKGWGHR